jgi:hypothetical protein
LKRHARSASRLRRTYPKSLRPGVEHVSERVALARRSEASWAFQQAGEEFAEL